MLKPALIPATEPANRPDQLPPFEGELPAPANDNICLRCLRKYLARLKAHAGADYVPAGAKSWWVP